MNQRIKKFDWVWLRRSEAMEIGQSTDRDIQTLVIRTEVGTLIHERIGDTFEIPDEVGGGSLRQLYAFDRLLGWLCVISAKSAPETQYDEQVVEISCPYIQNQQDWESLRRLEGLSPHVFYNSPVFISSRQRDASHEVVRRDWRGWEEVVYSASSQSEADSLRQFLSGSSLYTYEVRRALGPQAWNVSWLDGIKVKHIGRYSSKGSACRFAYVSSLASPESRFYVNQEGVGELAEAYSFANGVFSVNSHR